MKDKNHIQLGIVGACGRGATFKQACEASGRVTISAVCDVNARKLDETAHDLGAKQQYNDYQRMLDEARLDAVIVATPMMTHAEQTVAALQRGLHVLCEVPAAVSVEGCRAMVETASASQGQFMMAENYTFLKQNVMVREMVRRGEFGKTYYGEGEYIHELSSYNPVGGWRRRWQTGINGVTYGTHSLGPILQWMPGDRVAAVSCIGAGRHHRDDNGKLFENEAGCVMLCRMRSGGLVKVRIDMLSHRPHAMNNYQLQGTHGCYESARAEGETDRIWLASRGEAEKWMDLKSVTLEDEFLPEFWKQGREAAKLTGHGGGDFFELMEFVEVALGERSPSVGIHEAMDMTLPGLISQQSIREDNAWLAVPDSRTWLQPEFNPDQLRMTWPAPATNKPATADVPTGYKLRQMTDEDESAVMALMDRVGFNHWSRTGLRSMRQSILPGGANIIEHEASGDVVATAFAQHASHKAHPFGAQLGWVTADPAHRGKRLGAVVCAASTARLADAGYDDIYLLTDDFRLPAIKTYLNLGWRPVLAGSQMTERWAVVQQQLGLA